MRTRDMRATPGMTPTISAEDSPFTLHVSKDGGQRVVEIGGELDLATRHRVHRACLAGRRKVVVVVEMADMTFMDCSGYGGLVAARRMLQHRGGSLTLRNQAGQPAEFLSMLAALEAS
ncbi:MAG: STAS domain-containing protein [Ilumatobacteraceae bacterium]